MKVILAASLLAVLVSFPVTNGFSALSPQPARSHKEDNSPAILSAAKTAESSRRHVIGNGLLFWTTSMLLPDVSVAAISKVIPFLCVYLHYIWSQTTMHSLVTYYLFACFPLSSFSHAHTQDLKEDYRQGTAALADMDSNAPVPREAYKKLDSGVIYADLLQPLKGSASANSATVGPGSKVNMDWVLRKSNGYFVDSSEVVGSPFIFTVGDGTAIKGVDEGVRGMKQGGIRRILMPPKLAYVEGLEDGKPGPLPAGFGPRQQMRRV